MKRLMTNTGAKAGAVLILTLCVLLFISSIAGTVYLYGTNAVDKKGLRYYETDFFQYNLSDSAFQYMGYYYYNSERERRKWRRQLKEVTVQPETRFQAIHPTHMTIPFIRLSSGRQFRAIW